MPGAKTAEGEFVVPAELEAYFDLVEAESGERAAAEAALAEAERRAKAQADRSMHLTDTAKDTVNGALTRIGGDLDAGRDAGDALDEVKGQIVRLLAEERASLAALRNELAPVAQQPDEPVAEEKPAAPDLPATPEPATETPAANPADAWSADQRRDVSAYLDVLDEADRAHAELMKAKRELKKITNTETDEWEIAADKVTTLEKAWRDKKADARARETAFGALDATLVDLDVGRKAGREALRKQIAEAAPVTTREAPASAEKKPREPDTNKETEPAPGSVESHAPVAETTTAEARPEEAGQAERTGQVKEQFERLASGLEEAGAQEISASEEIAEHLRAIVTALEDRSYRNWQVGELRDTLVGLLTQLDQWKGDWQATLQQTIGYREEAGTIPPEAAAEALSASAARAEESELTARTIAARLGEAIETARTLAYQDGRNDPDGIVSSLAYEIENRVNVIPVTVSQKREEILGAREMLLSAV